MAGGSNIGTFGGPGKQMDLSQFFKDFQWPGPQGQSSQEAQHPGFSPPFPYGGANAQPVYPQLSGGPWNQMTQQMAGPGYQGLAPPAAPPARPGMSTTQPIPGFRGMMR